MSISRPSSTLLPVSTHSPGYKDSLFAAEMPTHEVIDSIKPEVHVEIAQISLRDFLVLGVYKTSSRRLTELLLSIRLPLSSLSRSAPSISRVESPLRTSEQPVSPVARFEYQALSTALLKGSDVFFTRGTGMLTTPDSVWTFCHGIRSVILQPLTLDLCAHNGPCRQGTMLPQLRPFRLPF